MVSGGVRFYHGCWSEIVSIDTKLVTAKTFALIFGMNGLLVGVAERHEGQFYVCQRQKTGEEEDGHLRVKEWY